jgi:putative membrane protein
VLRASHKKIIYRHIYWLYLFRIQLLTPTPWEYTNQPKSIQIQTKPRMRMVGMGLVDDVATGEELRERLPANEYERLINTKNTAIQIID